MIKLFKGFNLFKKKKDPIASSGMKMITDNGNGFYSWDGNLYKSDIIRSIVRQKATQIGKLTPRHIRGSTEIKINPEPYIKHLLYEPNPLMGMQQLLEKMIVQMELNGNAYALIIYDEFGLPNQIYPVPAVNTEAIYNDNILFLKFTFKNGQTLTAPYSQVIHLRKDFYSNDIFGESQAEALKPLMEVINTTDQGIVSAIKKGAIIKWILKFNQVLHEDDIKKETKKFVDNYLDIDTEMGGAAATDMKYDLEQVKDNSYVPNPLYTDKTMARLYNYFNTNEKIVQSKCNEDEWNTYYETQIEPVAIQLSNEFTRKLFTRKERAHENAISFEANNLQFASMNTKIQLVQMVDRGALTPNEWRNIMGLGQIEGGEKPIRRLDTALVNENSLKGGENNNE